ncbi:hypothetical protein HOY82DRAFT_493002 [Tuber indicum]|nr:hypothetical protein HOY82DRAFT_493002 [Tuber indicum]
MHFSAHIITTTILILTSSLLNSPVLANNHWTRIFLRIEGSAGVIYEDIVSTTGSIVTTKSGGTHMCDGTNNDANDTPGSTIISAIDDAVLPSGWDGTWNSKTRDYTITSIGEDSEGGSMFWGMFVENKRVDKGKGCQTKVSMDNHVLVAFGTEKIFGFGAKAFLKASADKEVVHLGGSVVFTVVDMMGEKPVKGARMIVGGDETDVNGEVTVEITGDPGVRTYKASMNNMIRSPVVSVEVKPQPSGNGRG